MFSRLRSLTIHAGLGLTSILLISALLASLTGDMKLGSTLLLISIGCGLGWAYRRKSECGNA